MSDKLSAKPDESPDPSAPKRYDIFISHASEDTEVGRSLANALSHRGVACWFDDELNPGEDWSSVLRKAIEQSKMCLLIVTKGAESKPWVSKEWSLVQANAWKRDDLAVLPVLLDDVKTPTFLRRWQSLRCNSRSLNFDLVTSQIVERLGRTSPIPALEDSQRDQAEAAERFREIIRTLEKASESSGEKNKDSDE